MTERQPVVLIVEDDEAFAYAASRHLQSIGYRTIVVDGSMAALAKLEYEWVDLVLTDVVLRKGEPHGLALGRMVALRQPGIPVVLVTAYPDIIAGQALPGPMLHKPVALNLLARAVDTSLSEYRPRA